MIPNHALASLIHAQTHTGESSAEHSPRIKAPSDSFIVKPEKELLRGMFVLKIEQRDAETPLCSEMIYFRRKLQGHAARRL